MSPGFLAINTPLTISRILPKQLMRKNKNTVPNNGLLMKVFFGRKKVRTAQREQTDWATFLLMLLSIFSYSLSDQDWPLYRFQTRERCYKGPSSYHTLNKGID